MFCLAGFSSTCCTYSFDMRYAGFFFFISTSHNLDVICADHSKWQSLTLVRIGDVNVPILIVSRLREGFFHLVRKEVDQPQNGLLVIGEVDLADFHVDLHLLVALRDLARKRLENIQSHTSHA